MESNPYQAVSTVTFASDVSTDTRLDFLRKTYAHLSGAVVLFVLLEALLMRMPGVQGLAMGMSQGMNWLLVLGAFMLVNWAATAITSSMASLGVQYMGLALYIVAEAVIFVPLMYVATRFGGPNVIATAGAVTLMLFVAMSGIVYSSRVDFSFLRVGLYMGGFVALGLIVASVVFGFTLGVFFTAAMIGFACLWILHDTSRIIREYRPDQYVAASLSLFASLATLFWYVLRLALQLQRR